MRSEVGGVRSGERGVTSQASECVVIPSQAVLLADARLHAKMAGEHQTAKDKAARAAADNALRVQRMHDMRKATQEV